ncbi:hypothetical protein EDF46_1392 [Frondihabitans sp. PhB188]|uniref:hypothetical protein n=1 Tax=Frondihabitans sp. PhB188 TaxID=2485200 RepID=UPI000F9A64B8|nr:hypothetical protein [Frondihabitans sp. PhB188]ROQ39760.1 hypothetical protein EDF46_1392 [Frondihabitans sp. PhB188]
MSESTRHRGRPAGVRLAIVALALGVAVTLGVTGHGLVDTQAAFSDSGAATGTFSTATATAATGVTCTNNADGSTVTISWTYSGATPTGFDVLVGAGTTTVPGATRTVVLAGGGLLALGLNQPIRVRTNLSSNWTATSAAVTVNVLSLAGLAAVRCA